MPTCVREDVRGVAGLGDGDSSRLCAPGAVVRVSSKDIVERQWPSQFLTMKKTLIRMINFYTCHHRPLMMPFHVLVFQDACLLFRFLANIIDFVNALRVSTQGSPACQCVLNSAVQAFSKAQK